MKLYKVKTGILLEQDEAFRFQTQIDWDVCINHNALAGYLDSLWQSGLSVARDYAFSNYEFLAPVGSQEVWAAGVTYYKSRTARMEESQEEPGGGGPYDRVYHAVRPELFFKARGENVRGSGQPVRIRKDSEWNVPEPEFTLVVNSKGDIVGYTIGNDMSSRSIEGENPLYLPQAKVYDGSAAIGPCIWISETPPASDTEIRLQIMRDNTSVFEDCTSLAQMKRKPVELVEYLYRELSFFQGCYLMTGTGIVPGSDFTLASGDEIHIEIAGIGTLINQVA